MATTMMVDGDDADVGDHLYVMMTATDGKGNCIGGSFLQAGSRKSGTLRFGASRELASTSRANLQMEKMHKPVGAGLV